MIRFHNTLSGKLEDFTPLRPGEVKLYTCGPTVYDYAHIGNFRTFVFEDLLRRFLIAEGFSVKHVMNITDVDDKTIAGAAKAGKDLREHTDFYLAAFQEDCRTLNILVPTVEPRATDEISGPGGMIELIEKLVACGVAYEKEGSVYYRVSAFKAYGQLSKKNLEMNIDGARVDVDEYDKEKASDFVLWKARKEGEPSWESPWGPGRPGWHIECSAMSMKYLHETFDIHAGGEDLIFPHHENEIAQSEAATGKPFVKYWLHSKHLMVNNEKMSKSKGNFYTLRDLLNKGHDPMAVRYALLAAHYRNPLNFTEDSLKEAQDSVKKMDDCYFQCLSLREMGVALNDGGNTEENELPAYFEKMLAELADDLNISAAFAVLHGVIHRLNALTADKKIGMESLQHALGFFREVDDLLGLDVAAESKLPEEILKLMRKRAEIRSRIKEQNDKSLWPQSDALRDEIQAKGWLIKDGRPGEPSIIKKKRRKWD